MSREWQALLSIIFRFNSGTTFSSAPATRKGASADVALRRTARVRHYLLFLWIISYLKFSVALWMQLLTPKHYSYMSHSFIPVVYSNFRCTLRWLHRLRNFTDNVNKILINELITALTLGHLKLYYKVTGKYFTNFLRYRSLLVFIEMCTVCYYKFTTLLIHTIIHHYNTFYFS